MITCPLGLYSIVSSSYAHECKNNGVATTKMYCMEKGKYVIKKIRNRKSLTLCLYTEPKKFLVVSVIDNDNKRRSNVV